MCEFVYHLQPNGFCHSGNEDPMATHFALWIRDLHCLKSNGSLAFTTIPVLTISPHLEQELNLQFFMSLLKPWMCSPDLLVWNSHDNSSSYQSLLFLSILYQFMSIFYQIYFVILPLNLNILQVGWTSLISNFMVREVESWKLRII